MSYTLSDIKPLDGKHLEKGIFLTIINIDKIPPHIGIVVNGKVFMLNAEGKVSGQKTSHLLKVLSSKNKPSLFVKIKDEKLDALKLMKDVFSEYKSAGSGVTCLAPIKDFCGSYYGISCSEARFVFELLPILRKAGKIESAFGLNIKDNRVKLPSYTMEEILKRIVDLQQKDKTEKV